MAAPFQISEARPDLLFPRGSRCRALSLLCLLSFLSIEPIQAQVVSDAVVAQSPTSSVASPVDAAAELRLGSDLTRRGMLADAIPHLQAALQAGADRYASTVNLAICALGLRRYSQTIDLLTSLRSAGIETATIENLLTQAYLGNRQTALALKAFADAAALTPTDEKLYAFIADACTDHRDYALGLRVTEIGLQHLPDSSRLHYEHALFLAQLDRLDEARPEFAHAARLAPGTYIASLAQVQAYLYDDRFPEAIALLREVIHPGQHDAQPDAQVLSLLGTVLIDAGALPGSPEFAEAQTALEQSARLRPASSSTQLALGKLYSMESRYTEAAEHLELALRLEPDNPAIYTNLGHVYRRLGDREKAAQMQASLAALLAARKTATLP